MIAKDHVKIIDTMIRRGRPWEKHKDMIMKASQDYSLSQAFGWTPKEIDEMGYDKRMMYLSLMSGVTEE